MIRAAALAAALLALAGCRDETVSTAQVGLGEISTWQDQKRGVTCWVYEGYKKGGISCLPDWMLVRQAEMILRPEAP